MGDGGIECEIMMQKKKTLNVNEIDEKVSMLMSEIMIERINVC